MMNSQRSNTEKVNLIEEGKKTSIDEIIKHNEIVNTVYSLKYFKSSCYCLKCSKNTESIN